MYRVVVKLNYKIYKKEFDSYADAKKYYDTMKAYSKKVWLLDVTQKQIDDKVTLLNKMFTILDKICGK